ncbi:hypothetical protein [Brevibacillus laterosporus]|uniref:hypothetical protein n=1 Tax=Brevibacillus laterosporus TaxID=1465 RepID=UPI003D206353
MALPIVLITMKFHVKVEGRARSKGIQSYKLEIDTDTKTYKTTELTKKEIEEDILNEEDLKELKELSTKPLRISPNERKNYYIGWMKITTEDPVRLPVCTTKLTLKWEEDIDGLIEETSHKLKPWAANPTKFDTHWYIDYSGDLLQKQTKTTQKLPIKVMLIIIMMILVLRTGERMAIMNLRRLQ